MTAHFRYRASAYSNVLHECHIFPQGAFGNESVVSTSRDHSIHPIVKHNIRGHSPTCCQLYCIYRTRVVGKITNRGRRGDAAPVESKRYYKRDSRSVAWHGGSYRLRPKEVILRDTRPTSVLQHISMPSSCKVLCSTDMNAQEEHACKLLRRVLSR